MAEPSADSPSFLDRFKASHAYFLEGKVAESLRICRELLLDEIPLWMRGECHRILTASGDGTIKFHSNESIKCFQKMVDFNPDDDILKVALRNAQDCGKEINEDARETQE